MARDPSQPNLRQVHLIHQELLDELGDLGFTLTPGELGENITTGDINLLGLCRGTQLHFPDGAVVEITGLRNPCQQIEKHQAGLLAAVLDHDSQGHLVRKAGVMAVVVSGGRVATGDCIDVVLPAGKQEALRPV